MLKTAAYITGASMAISWAYVRNLQLPKGPDRSSWGRQVFGHRGCRDVAGIPENTLEAFHYAMTNGASGIEIDVKLSKDKEVMVFHDGNTRRMMEGDSKWVHCVTAEDLKQLTFKDDPTGKIQIPTLMETIKFCQDNFLQCLIEIKETQDVPKMTEKILQFYARYGDEFMYQHTTVISFNPKVLYKLREKDPKIAICVLHSGTLIRSWVEGGTEPVPAVMRSRFFPLRAMDALVQVYQAQLAPWVCGASMIGPKYTLLNKKYLEKWKHRGICVYLWGFDPNANPQELYGGLAATGAGDENVAVTAGSNGYTVGPEMLDSNVFIAVDKKYAAYGAIIHEAKRLENADNRLAVPSTEGGDVLLGQ